MSDATVDGRRYLIPFRSGLLPQIFCDTLVIGSGVAGLRAAIAAAEHGEVIVLCKDEPPHSNTAWAQGGIATVTAHDDTAEAHVRDTLAAGAGLCDEDAARRIVADGPGRIAELIGWGMRFDTDPAGTVHLGREGGHGAARILHADGDATGRELMRVLLERTAQTRGVRLFGRCFALDLITPGGPASPQPVMGAITHHPKHGLQVIWAKATILASGGAGMVYRETTNPRVATGDGLAMAFRAGALIADAAFFQFHPTTLYIAGAARSLISEAVRGQGATLIDQDGRRFMLEDPQAGAAAELAPRDVVTRAIVRRMAQRGLAHVWLDCRHVPDFARQFPSIAHTLRRFDLDPASSPIPVHPAAHYHCGGVATDAHGRTSLPGLYAAGEVACTGLHGANRLASNSLLEGLVMGAVAGQTAREMTQHAASAPHNGPAHAAPPHGGNGLAHAPGALPPGWELGPRAAPAPVISDIRPSDAAELDLADVSSSLRSGMWRTAGIERSGQRLTDLADMIAFWSRYTMDKIFDDVRGWEVQNLLTVASLIARSALWRQESRGCHWRSDFPAQRDQLRAHDLWTRGSDAPACSTTLAAGLLCPSTAQ
ncbi:MAG: L-aspartate oxidase, partial [Planctomyces sp.]|nr:L-aspartate oxidase [Planctomyces sp.]